MMNFSGEPEIAVVSQDQYEDTNIVNRTPCFCNGRIWAVIAQNQQETHFCLAAQQQHQPSLHENEDEDANSAGGFVEVTSFPPSSSSSSSNSNQQQEYFVSSRVIISASSGLVRNFVVAIRQSDGVFLVADADSLRAVGMGALTDEEGNSVSVSCVTEDEDKSRLFVFAQKKTIDDVNINNNNNNNNNKIENSIFSIQLLSNNLDGDEQSGTEEDLEGGVSENNNNTKISIRVTECLCFQTGSKLLNAKLVPNLNIIIITREGGVVELFSRKLIMKLLLQNNNAEQEDQSSPTTLLLSRFVLSSVQATSNCGELTAIAFDFSSSSTTTSTLTQQNQNNTSSSVTAAVLPIRLFCCTSKGFAIVLSIIIEAGGKMRLRFKKLLKVIQSSNSNSTTCSIVSAVVACSTIWFSDRKGGVRIWSLETLEELGSLNSTIGTAPSPSSARESEERQDGDDDTTMMGMRKSPVNQISSSRSEEALILEMSELEFRQSIGVFRKPPSSSSSSSRCDIQSLVVKQAASSSSSTSQEGKKSSIQELIDQLIKLQQQNNTTVINSKSLPVRQQQQVELASPASAPPPQPLSTVPQPMTTTNHHQSSSNNATVGRSASVTSTSSSNNNNTLNITNKTTTDDSQQQKLSSSAAIKFIKQLCEILTNKKKPSSSTSNINNNNNNNNNITSEPVEIPEKILKAVPEAEYLEAALSSVAACSSIVGQTLPDLNLRPSSLTQDVSTICDMSSRLFRNEGKMRKVVSNLEKELMVRTTTTMRQTEKNGNIIDDNHDQGESSASSSSFVDSLTTLCRKLASQHETEVQNLTKRIQELENDKKQTDETFSQMDKEHQLGNDALVKELQKLREENEKVKIEMAEQKKNLELEMKRKNEHQDPAFPHGHDTARAFPHSSIVHHDDDEKEQQSSSKQSLTTNKKARSTSSSRAYVDDNVNADKDELIEKLQAELKSKSSLVKHLMQLTNDNGKVIDEMRQHSIQRRDECIELRRKIREVEDRHLFFIEASVEDIDQMLDETSFRNVAFMLQSLKQKLTT